MTLAITSPAPQTFRVANRRLLYLPHQYDFRPENAVSGEKSLFLVWQWQRGALRGRVRASG